MLNRIVTQVFHPPLNSFRVLCIVYAEMSRKAVNVVSRGFNQEAIKYNWRRKVANYLPDHQSTVVSSILFMPLPNEHYIDSITIRAMAWLTATISSGTPIVFVNIQTEQIVSLVLFS